MNLLSVSRRIARGVTARADLLERVRQEITAATSRLFQRRGVLVPIRLVVDPQKRACPHD
jgi:hypothetical protein